MKSDWVSLPSLADSSGLSREYLRQLCLSGELLSHQRGRQRGGWIVSLSSWNAWNMGLAESQAGEVRKVLSSGSWEPDFSKVRKIR